MEVIAEMIAHEVDVILDEDNEWFMELIENAIKKNLKPLDEE